MPTILNVEGFRFYFFSDEGNEPCYIHVKKGGARGKIWLLPKIEENYYYGFTEPEKRKIRELIKVYSELIIEKWNEYFK